MVCQDVYKRQFENSIVVVDCGLSFPENDMLGIDLVIPDITYLKNNVEKVKGFVITHGHEDHIGALPYILKELAAPIYATKLTMGLIENKLKEHNLMTVSYTHLDVYKRQEECWITAKIMWVEEAGMELPSKIYLFQGLPKGDKMELVIQKAVELGAYEIIPVATRRAVVKLDAKKEQNKQKRWNAISESAAKQSLSLIHI